jgi:hypothetical protein
MIGGRPILYPVIGVGQHPGLLFLIFRSLAIVIIPATVFAGSSFRQIMGV